MQTLNLNAQQFQMSHTFYNFLSYVVSKLKVNIAVIQSQDSLDNKNNLIELICLINASQCNSIYRLRSK